MQSSTDLQTDKTELGAHEHLLSLHNGPRSGPDGNKCRYKQSTEFREGSLKTSDLMIDSKLIKLHFLMSI